jgi:cell division protein FtsB
VGKAHGSESLLEHAFLGRAEFEKLESLQPQRIVEQVWQRFLAHKVSVVTELSIKGKYAPSRAGFRENRLNPPVNYDSVTGMTGADARILTRRERFSQFGACGYLLLLGALALAGPSGFLAWGENLSTLDQRQAQIARLTSERDELKNRVALLNPNHADADFAGELVRERLNVMRPDEVVYQLGKSGS